MTGTGRAITNTPEREHTPPTIFPAIVPGTMSPYPSVVIVTIVYQKAAGIEVKFVSCSFFSA